MRISIVNVNMVPEDAIGRCIVNQFEYFSRRGNTVMLFLQHRPDAVPPVAEGAIQWGDKSGWTPQALRHFEDSNLCIYHYPGKYPLLDTLKAPGRG